MEETCGESRCSFSSCRCSRRVIDNRRPRANRRRSRRRAFPHSRSPWSLRCRRPSPHPLPYPHQRRRDRRRSTMAGSIRLRSSWRVKPWTTARSSLASASVRSESAKTTLSERKRGSTRCAPPMTAPSESGAPSNSRASTGSVSFTAPRARASDRHVVPGETARRPAASDARPVTAMILDHERRVARGEARRA